MNLRQYNKDRDNAIIELVKTGSLEEWYKVAKKYDMMFPKNERILKASLYKAAQACVNIPEEIKEKGSRRMQGPRNESVHIRRKGGERWHELKKTF